MVSPSSRAETRRAALSSGRLQGRRVMPAVAFGDNFISFFWSPTAALIRANQMVVLKDSVYHFPCGLNRIFTGEERSIAGHSVAEEPFVGRFRAQEFFEQVEFPLVADEFLPDALDASGEGNSRFGGKLEAQIVGPADRRR